MKIRVYVADVWAETFESDEIEDLGEEVISLFCKDYTLKRTKEIEDLIIWSAKSVIMGENGFEVSPLVISEDVKLEFPKNHNRVYHILDIEAYKRFWCGRKPSTRKVYEEWLHTPTITMNAVGMKNKLNSIKNIERINRELRHQGIIEVRLGPITL